MKLIITTLVTDDNGLVLKSRALTFEGDQQTLTQLTANADLGYTINAMAHATVTEAKTANQAENELLDAAQTAWQRYITEVEQHHSLKLAAALRSVRRLTAGGKTLNLICAHNFACALLQANQPALEKTLRNILNRPTLQLNFTTSA